MIDKWFMKVAQGLLHAATFDEIYRRAVVKEREEIEHTAAKPKRPIVAEGTIARLAMAFGDDPPETIRAHAETRFEERLEVAVTQADMAELLRFVKAGGPNVEIARQHMDLVQELTVNWRGRHFVVVWSKTREKLITVKAKTRKIKRQVWTGRPRDKPGVEFDPESW